MKKRVTLFSLSALVVLFLGGVIGWFSQIHYAAGVPSKLREIRENSTQYHYINPLLFIETQRVAPEYNGLQSLIQKNISDAKSSDLAEKVSAYFRDLNTGRWTGIDEGDPYDPGSMLKVLTLMTYLKKTETDPSSIYKKMNYVAKVDPGQFYKPQNPLPSGEYTVEKLLESMVLESDNNSALLLLNNDQSGFADTYSTLNLPPLPASNTVDFMSPKSYSTLFRTLFNATYLSRSLSEQALFLLSNTTFTKGLVAGVPAGTTVAHKFGENTVKRTDGSVYSRELHDCGIVYYPEHPYLICVMTKGNDFSKLETVISTISKTVYTSIDALNK